MLLNQLIRQIYYHYYLIRNVHSLGQLLFLFLLFSILGWLLETVYRTKQKRRLVNPGFLRGPIVPLYGVAGILILTTYLHTHEYSILLRILFYFVTITVLEFITGEVMLRLFKKRLWDYRDEMLNFRGHVCLSFSFAWAILSVVFEQILYPFSIGLLLLIPENILPFINGTAILVVQTDLIYSSGILPRIRNFVSERMSSLSERTGSSLLHLRQMMFYAPEFHIKLKQIPGLLPRIYKTRNHKK